MAGQTLKLTCFVVNESWAEMRGDNVLHAGKISLGMRGDSVLHAGGGISLGMRETTYCMLGERLAWE